MTPVDIALVGTGAFTGGVAFGVAGFAFGIVASVFWLHALPAADVVPMVVAGSLLLNLALLPRFHAEIDWRRARPFLVGATAGLPVGLAMLAAFDAAVLRRTIGALILAYCAAVVAVRRRQAVVLGDRGGAIADGGIGFVGGAIGGVSGLAPLVPSFWYGLRGLDKRQQRALTQPFGLYTQGLAAVLLLAFSPPSRASWGAMLIALPMMLAGVALGNRLFDRLGPGGFFNLLLALSLAGAFGLLAR